ncbi:ribosome maturation factor RimM [mine drainage metagenome]|uniref:Ribosome maturation factor RimM n=1 Tax=mine drainage metagenome TaxID=410659 RepID=A0A1J5QZ44_9ZZZZ
MGRISVPYGLKGWVSVNPDTEALDGLFDYPVWWVQLDAGWHEFAVEDAKVHGDHLVAKLEGIADRDQAFRLKGRPVAVPREQLPEAEEGEYYWSDLVGLEVENLQQVKFGTISEVFATGANDVLVVKGERERLVPFIDQVVLEVDIPARRMVVDWDAEF